MTNIAKKYRNAAIALLKVNASNATFWSVTQISEITGYSMTKLYAAIKAKRLRSINLGTIRAEQPHPKRPEYVIPKESLVAYLTYELTLGLKKYKNKKHKTST